MEDWTDKYRPKSLDKIFGNERAIATLRNWAHMWSEGNVPKNRAVVLTGKAGKLSGVSNTDSTQRKI